MPRPRIIKEGTVFQANEWMDTYAKKPWKAFVGTDIDPDPDLIDTSLPPDVQELLKRQRETLARVAHVKEVRTKLAADKEEQEALNKLLNEKIELKQHEQQERQDKVD